MRLNLVCIFIALSCWIGCASVDYADQLKMVALTPNLTSGHEIGPLESERCRWRFLGFSYQSRPSMDSVLAPWRESGIRYINNVSAKFGGFNALLLSQECLVVSGVGFK